MNSPALNRHERRRQQTRQRLIQAAVALLLEEGYDAMNIQAITDRADLGRGTFYIHFQDKEDSVWSAIKDLMLELEQQAHRELAGRTPANVEYQGLLNIFRHAEKNRGLYRALLGGNGSAILMGRLQDLLAQMFLYDIRMARKDQDANHIIPEEILAQILTGIITRLIFWWLETPNEYTAEQMAAMTYQAIYQKAPFSV